jgi:hypothetical protein
MAQRHKYHAQPTEVDGIRFDSKREARRYSELRLLERAGEITHLERQPEYPIIVKGEKVRALPDKRGRQGSPLKYVADFAYFADGKRVVEDCKGMDTPVSRLKRALVRHIYNVEVRIT